MYITHNTCITVSTANISWTSVSYSSFY